MKNITIDLTIKGFNGKHIVTLDRMKNISVENGIEILQIKYQTKGLFDKICKGFGIMSKDMDALLKRENDGNK